MSGYRRLAAVVVVGVMSVSAFGVAATGAEAADNECTAVVPTVAPDLWAQQLLAPQTVWPFTHGAGERVAVVDSGVDADQPQLHGQVDNGYDAITDTDVANTDCIGTGTEVAGAIAAARTSATGIYGVAPQVTIVPVRVVGEPGSNNTATPTPAVLAAGINRAVDGRVDVIDVSVWLTVDDPAVRQAVAAAVAAGITVVAAAGDSGTPDGGNPTTYPAAYPGVIGVAAVDSTGLAWPDSEHGNYVDLVAPGVNVPALQRVRGLVDATGTAIAAGFVSGTAALVRARHPGLHGAQIVDQLLATASPTAGGPYYGHGLVNPYLAVATDRVATAPVPLSGLVPKVPDQAQLARAAAGRRSRTLAVDLTAGGLGALLIVIVIAVGVPRARRRAWTANYAAPLRERFEPDEPAPLALLFEDPSNVS